MRLVGKYERVQFVAYSLQLHCQYRRFAPPLLLTSKFPPPPIPPRSQLVSRRASCWMSIYP